MTVLGASNWKQIEWGDFKWDTNIAHRILIQLTHLEVIRMQSGSAGGD